jgi:hypothetical protein
MHGGATVKHNRNATKRTHKVRRPQIRNAYYTLKKPNMIKYKNYFKGILPKRTPKTTVQNLTVQNSAVQNSAVQNSTVQKLTQRKSERLRRERIPFDPSIYNTVKTMKNRGATATAAAAEVANDRMSAVVIPSVAKERLAVVNKARELYGVSDATKNVRAAFIRLYMRAKQPGVTPSQALFAAQNEIAAKMAASAGLASAGPAPAFAAPAFAAPAPAFAAPAPAFAAPAAASARAFPNDNIEAMLLGLRI